jgi:hypothetical protein
VPVRTVGVDLAAEPARTAVAVLSWDDGKAVVEELREHLTPPPTGTSRDSGVSRSPVGRRVRNRPTCW